MFFRPKMRLNRIILQVLLVVWLAWHPVAGHSTRKLQQFTCPEIIPGCASCDNKRAVDGSLVYFCNKCANGLYLTFDKRFCYCPPGTFWNGIPAPAQTACSACNAPPFQVGAASNNSAWCRGGSKSAMSLDEALPGRTLCGEGLYTNIVKASKATACVLKPGWFLSQQNPDLASPCAGNTHNKGGNRVAACLSCKSGLGVAPDEPGLSPQERAATRQNEQACQVPAGRYWALGATRACEKGSWREGFLPRSSPNAFACRKCPAGLLTEATGASTFDKCNVIPGGYELRKNDADLSLQPCPHGTFAPQRKINLTAPDQAWGCQACPFAYTTKQRGATSDEPCKAPPGYFVARMGSDFYLTKCPSGFFRAGWAKTHTSGLNFTAACSTCGQGVLSQETVPDEHPNAQPNSLVSSSSENCYVPEGWGAVLDLSAGGTRLTAYPCPLATYGQAKKSFGLSPVSCTACTPGLITDGWASIGEDACKHAPGFGYRFGAFTRCPVGSYNPANSMEACAECPPGRTTLDDANFQADPTDCFPQPGQGVLKVEADAAIMAIISSTNGAATGPTVPMPPVVGPAPQPAVGSPMPQPVVAPAPGEPVAAPAPEPVVIAGSSAAATMIDEKAAPLVAAALAALGMAECREGTYSKVDAPGGASAKLTRLMQYCSDCPAGSTTWDAASASVEDCNVCLPGHQKTSRSCTPCPVGFFQSERDEDAVCMPCPDSTLSFANKETFTAPGLTPAEGAVTEALCYPSVFSVESLDESFNSILFNTPPGEELWAPFTTSSPAADFATCRATCPADSCCLLSHAYDDMGNGGTGGTCTRILFDKLSQTALNEGRIPLVSLHLKVPAAGTVSAATAAAAKTKTQAALAATQQPFEVLNVGLAPGNSSQILVKIKDAADGTVQMLTAEEFAKKYPGPQADDAEVKAQSAEFNGVYARCTVKATPTEGDYVGSAGADMWKKTVNIGRTIHQMYYGDWRTCEDACNAWFGTLCTGYAVLQYDSYIMCNLFAGTLAIDANVRHAVVAPSVS